MVAVLIGASVAVWTAFGAGKKVEPTSAPTTVAAGASVLGFTLNRIDGTPQPLQEYRGKVLLIVNVASQCGLTPQYEGLESLYESKKNDGLVVLGFPANNFGSQEPGTNSEIAAFCSGKFNVTFPMFEKISVKGEDQHPLYRMLASLPEPLGGDPKWNFTKFLVDRSGNVVARYEPKTKPDDAALVAQIDKLLAENP
ncbi:MAG: glutathione peroxidase [Phycisphaerae bacterium]|nr:glutathione peroxidase [Phycisphaerae bacterium]